jgi:hypothetical protein
MDVGLVTSVPSKAFVQRRYRAFCGHLMGKIYSGKAQFHPRKHTVSDFRANLYNRLGRRLSP